MDGISSTPFAAVVPQRIEASTSLDAVNAQRKGSVSFTAADGPKNRSSTGPSSVRSDVPAIVQTYVGTSRATVGDLGDTAVAATKENVAPDIVALDGAAGTDGKRKETRKKGHARGPSFFGRLSFKRSNSSMEAKNQETPQRTEQAGAMMVSIVEALTAKEAGLGGKAALADAKQHGESATQGENVESAVTVLAAAESGPDEMPVLVKANEIEEAPLDAENRPPLVDERKQKKGKSGGLFACIRPRTEGE